MSLPGTSVPSPAPSSVSNSGKRKRDAFSSVPKKPTAVELSRQNQYMPTETLGQVQIAIDYLKQTNSPKTFDELLRYMSLHRASQEAITRLEKTMKAQRHPKIDYNPKTDMFKYKPLLPVHDPESLKAYLQTRKNMVGVKVEDLKDGWPDCIPQLESMAGKGEILIGRTGPSKPRNTAVDFSTAGMNAPAPPQSAREKQPRTVWPSDATLVNIVPLDLKMAWHTIKLPELDETLREKLVSAGLKPTTAPVQHVSQQANTVKKARKPRKNAKGTATNANVPMRDYSHLRK